MLVLRLRIQCQPDRSAEVAAALAAVVEPARAVSGVHHFDIARDLLDTNAFIATEVFEDSAARERQESLGEVGTVMRLLPECLAAPPEATLYHVSSTEPAM
jgi:quinol monooxygenase YgiN